MRSVGFVVSLMILVCPACWPVLGQERQPTNLEKLAGQPADVAPSAYQYRADRKSEENPPESWIGLMKYASLPFDKTVDVNAPALKKVLCGLMWEEVLWLVRSLTRAKEVVGFDIMELSPIPGLRAPDFLAAKLLNKVLGYTCPPGAVATDRSHR